MKPVSSSPKLKVIDAHHQFTITDLDALPPPQFAEVAFAGRSNVGKSSLINALTSRRKLVRTSNTPGCTRSIHIFRVTLTDAILDFVDLPGYGYAKRSKAERIAWGALIEGFLRLRDNLRAVVLILDIRRGVQPDDQQLIEYLQSLNKRILLVVTKIDKLAPSKRKPALLEIGRRVNSPTIGFSAKTIEGREQLWEAILRELLER